MVRRHNRSSTKCMLQWNAHIDPLKARTTWDDARSPAGPARRACHHAQGGGSGGSGPSPPVPPQVALSAHT
eukprot:1057602-Pelagomonas_calceolata.AAC.4